MLELLKIIVELLGYSIATAKLIFDIYKWKKSSKSASKKQTQSHRKKRRQKNRKKRREKAPRVAARKRA